MYILTGSTSQLRKPSIIPMEQLASNGSPNLKQLRLIELTHRLGDFTSVPCALYMRFYTQCYE